MVVSDEHLLSVYQWLFAEHDGHKGALFWFLIMTAALALLALVFGYLVAAVRYGPMKAGDMTYRVVIGGFQELFSISPRRIWALAWLTVRESFRRARVWVGLVVFLLILLFAGWFLDAESVNPLKLYVDFVLTATTYLVLVLALFLSVFSLPNEFRSRTIYTLMTKPVYCGEIVLGRIIGFSIIGTMLLLVMGVCSYLFVVRALNHTHTVSPGDVKEIVGRSGKVFQGETSQSLRHRHTVTIDEDGVGRTDAQMGHWHEVERVPGSESFTVGPPRDLFQARVPHYGTLRFKDRTGNEAAKGISVGNEWAYRSFIEGGTLGAALWDFEGVTADKYPDGLPLEVNIRVFRSHKGVIENAIGGSILVRNPETKKESAARIFRAKDYYIDEQFIPRELTDKDGKTIDLFDDLVHDGKVEIQVQCLDRAQYFGVAKADCYLRAQNGRFDVNFLKSFVGIWVQMVIVTSFGVMFSTFLSGPIAMLATIGCIVMGFFAPFIAEVAKGPLGDAPGGGPFEALIRMVTHQNLVTELEPNLGNDLAKQLDKPIMYVMTNSANLLPNFASYSNVNWVASGFDIPASLVAQNVIACMTYVLGVVIAGYFFLRLRGSEMTQNRWVIRMATYAGIILVLLFPLFKLGEPPSRDPSGREKEGGLLAKIRKDHKLSQANLGEIDPASETMKLATLGMQGVGVFLLWNKATEYKKTEDWTNLSATLEQIAKLEPNFIKVWQYQAWNLSYNVSVEFDDYHDRYHWVIRGIDFLKKGVKANQDNPTLLWDLGWFTSQKIGRADEKVQYRRLFKADDEFHQDAPDRRREDRDNWLVGKEWFQKANDAVDLKGQSLKGKSPLIFYSDVPMAQMNYAEAIQDDGVHGEVARQAWLKASDDWNNYGQRPILNTDGQRIHLNDLERKRDDAARYRAELEHLVSGMAESIHRARLGLLTQEERDLLAIPPEKRDPEQQQTAYHVEKKIEVTPTIIAEEIKRETPEKAREAMRLWHLTNSAAQEVSNIESYRQIVNFEYWRTRAKMEQTPAALLARQKLYEANEAFKREADLVRSRKLYEEGFEQWRIALDEFPQMVELGSLPEELVDVVVDYKTVLDQFSNAPFPQDFVLRDVIESRDQEGRLRGFFTTPATKPKAGTTKLPVEGRPPEPREDEPEKEKLTPPGKPDGKLPTDGRPPEPKPEEDESSAATKSPAGAAADEGRPPEPKEEPRP